ncbi:hypothetical protein OPIT5_27150 [Opitutaceae bacterium TAV5]|nr:hypothetical protein OPIT5_27150 [Opitutaceae bacterium TAV5]
MHSAIVRLALVSGFCVLLPGVSRAQLIPPGTIETDTADSANRALELLPQREKKEGTPKQVPALYEGELEDAGPQYLLLSRPPHQWFQLLLDYQLYATSNAGLTEHDRLATDIMVFTAQGAVNVKPVLFAGGQLKPSFGLRYQVFAYGLLSGRHRSLSSTVDQPVKDLDFQTVTPYVQLEWQRDAWIAGVAGRFAAYLSEQTDSTTYQEWVPSVHAGRVFSLGPTRQILVDLDAGYRFSRSFLPPGLVLPPGWFNDAQGDRYDLGLNIVYTQTFGRNWILQPSYRFQFSDYTRTDNSRHDYYHILGLTLAYYFNEYVSLRLFGSAEFRDSTDDTIPDYKNLNGGVAGSLSVRF